MIYLFYMARKESGYTQIKAHAKRNKKRQEAELRQSKYDALSQSEKIALVISRGGSQKELTRLTQLKAKQPVQVPVVVEEIISPKRTPKSKVVRQAKSKRPSKS